MDFDPGFFSDYDDISDEDHEYDDGEIEYDALGNPIYLASAAGFGYHMSEDEIEEREIAAKILKERENKKREPVKVPLSKRHDDNTKHMTPFGRWADKVARDPSRRNEEIEYTLEEKLEILKAEAKGE